MRFHRTILTVIALSCAVGPAAAADDSMRDPEVDELLKQGIALRRSGNDEAALAVFLDVEKRNPDSVRVLLHITTAAQATGKWIMAYDYLQKASAHRDDPYYQRHKAAIENVESIIDQRVGQFRVRGSPMGAEVRLSGQLIGTLPMMGVRPVEVGSYVLEVSKPGYYPLRRPVTIAAGGGFTQEAVDLQEEPAPQGYVPAAPVSAPPSPAADVMASSPPAGWRARWVTWTLAGVGIAAAATSGVAFGIRENQAAQWNDNSQCIDLANNMLTRGQKCGGIHDRIKLAEDVGIAAGITAVVFGTAALVHGLVTARDRSPEGAGAAHADARKTICSPGLGSFVCSGSF